MFVSEIPRKVIKRQETKGERSIRREKEKKQKEKEKAKQKKEKQIPMSGIRVRIESEMIEKIW